MFLLTWAMALLTRCILNWVCICQISSNIHKKGEITRMIMHLMKAKEGICWNTWKDEDISQWTITMTYLTQYFIQLLIWYTCISVYIRRNQGKKDHVVPSFQVERCAWLLSKCQLSWNWTEFYCLVSPWFNAESAWCQGSWSIHKNGKVTKNINQWTIYLRKAMLAMRV